LVNVSFDSVLMQSFSVMYANAVADPDISFGGHEVERRRREDRGGGVWGGFWGGGIAPSPENFFQSFIKKRRVSVDSDV